MRGNGLLRIVVLVLLAGMVVACGGKKEPEGQVIPPDELVPVLEDLYVADGYFSLRYLREQVAGTDSMSNYRDILKKYGYTLRDMEKTIDYYTKEDHLEELKGVYDVVTKDLRDLLEKTFEEEHTAGMQGKQAEDLWVGPREYHLPREGQRDKIAVDIPLRGPGVYSLSLKIKISHNDGSKRPYIHLWFWKDDGTKEGKRIAWDMRRVPKDGRWHRFILAKKLTDGSMTHLKGYLVDDENRDTTYVKRVDIKEVRLDMKPLVDHYKMPVAK